MLGKPRVQVKFEAAQALRTAAGDTIGIVSP